MSRSRKGSKGPGYDYGQRRPANRRYNASPGGRGALNTKRLSNRSERMAARIAFSLPSSLRPLLTGPLDEVDPAGGDGGGDAGGGDIGDDGFGGLGLGGFETFATAALNWGNANPYVIDPYDRAAKPMNEDGD